MSQLTPPYVSFLVALALVAGSCSNRNTAVPITPTPQPIADVADLVLDIRPGSKSSFPQELTALGETLFFSADDGIHGRELWKTDGTAAGTVMVKDIAPGNANSGSQPSQMTPMGATMFFGANDVVHGYELWKTDGTAAGTVMVKDIAKGKTSASIFDPTAIRDRLVFSARLGQGVPSILFISDGTDSGTVEMLNVVNPTEFTAFAGEIYFAATGSQGAGTELWKTDGTPAGTVLVQDIKRGSFSSFPRRFEVVGDTLYFIATDSSLTDPTYTSNFELWKLQAGSSQATLVIDPWGIRGSWPAHLTSVGDTLYFSAVVNGSSGLYKTDGTAAGTVLLEDFGAYYSGKAEFIGYNTGGFLALQQQGLLLFAARASLAEPPDWDLWATGGTAETTIRLRDDTPKYPPLYPIAPGAGRTALLSIYDPVNGRELWSTDGTAAGTKRLTDLNPGTGSSGELLMREMFRGKLLFSADDGLLGFELYAFDPGANAHPIGYPCSVQHHGPTLGSEDPVIGTSFRMFGAGAKGHSGFLVFDFGDPKPFQFGAWCTIYNKSIDFYDVLQPSVEGTWSKIYVIPADDALQGVRLVAQAWMLPAHSTEHADATNGIELTLGR